MKLIHIAGGLFAPLAAAITLYAAKGASLQGTSVRIRRGAS